MQRERSGAPRCGLTTLVVASLWLCDGAVAAATPETGAARHFGLAVSDGISTGFLANRKEVIGASHFKASGPVIWEGKSAWSTSVEGVIAVFYILILSCLPFVHIGTIEKTSKTQLVCAILTFLSMIGMAFLFTNVVIFNCPHFREPRTLTLVETIYLMSQVVTTVGYGDITPAYTRGQVFVGLYVVFCLVLLAHVISDGMKALFERTKSYAQELSSSLLPHSGGPVAGDHKACAIPTSPRYTLRMDAPCLPYKRMIRTILVYLGFVLIGVLFYHLYPGEGKTWFEAFYMSTITLSTVGFGAFTPVTEFGLVFGAFWMLGGTASFMWMIGGISEMLITLKERETFDRQAAKKQLDALRDRLDGHDGVDRFEFLKFAILTSRAMPSRTLALFEQTFADFHPDLEGMVKIDEIDRVVHMEAECEVDTDSWWGETIHWGETSLSARIKAIAPRQLALRGLFSQMSSPRTPRRGSW
mmetsp:Transcript_87087/g.186716  ORF Transcript_87087/g.186716 Transcript_87087/m.186716 type:complete len:472 (+) Transcript_87087:63-1478(+)